VEASPPETPDPRVGAVLQGRYRLDAQLASGAMGVVYRGERLQLGRPVAVKFLHPWIATQKAFLTRFETEARAMSRLQHPNCVSVIDFGIEGTPYLVMDFVTGKTLREILGAGRLPPARALRLVRQLLAGLGYAHAQGIIHRDLKPENLILSDEPGLSDHLRILDFGLAKLRDGPAMTAGFAVGTPSYMSPEQTGADGGIDARTDLYAVGVVLFELLSGRKPFQSENVGELLLMHREQPPPLLRAVAPELSAAMEAVVSKALAKMADDRFQTAAEFATALDGTPEAGATRAPAAPIARAKTEAWAGRPASRPGAGVTANPVADATVVDRPAAASGIPPRPGAPRAEGAGGLPSPAPAAARPAPTADATMVESPSLIERIVAGETAPPAAAASAGTPRARDRRLLWAGVGLGAVAVAALLAGRALRMDASAFKVEAARPSAPAASGNAGGGSAAPPASATPANVADRLAEARRLIAGGAWEQARTSLEALRVDAPDDAEAAYLLATVDLEHHRYAEGMAAAQVAGRKNPALKSDPDLIKDVIGALASDAAAERAEAFLRAAGSSATPFLKDAAKRDPNARVRDRAASLLSSGGSSSSWSSRSSGSGSSLFHR
jgi:serine/threonine-protein kinase